MTEPATPPDAALLARIAPLEALLGEAREEAFRAGFRGGYRVADEPGGPMLRDSIDRAWSEYLAKLPQS
jgi:hypothetical protein